MNMNLRTVPGYCSGGAAFFCKGRRRKKKEEEDDFTIYVYVYSIPYALYGTYVCDRYISYVSYRVCT